MYVGSGCVQTQKYTYIQQEHLAGYVSSNRCAGIVGCSCYIFKLNHSIAFNEPHSDIQYPFYQQVPHTKSYEDVT